MKLRPWLILLLPLLCVPLLLLGCAANPEADAIEGDLSVANGIVRQDIDLWTADGVLHTEAVYEVGARLRPNRRVMMMVPGTLANGAGYYDVAPGTGYDAAEVLAHAGFIVALVDLPGTGESYRPEDGRVTRFEPTSAAVRRAALAYRIRFLVPTVDIYGETGVGTNVALLLAREPWVRTVTISAAFYREFGPASGQLFDPAFHAVLDSLPTGYLPQDPNLISFFFGAADPSVFPLALAATVGPAPQSIPTGAFYEIAERPFFVDPAGVFGPVFVLDTPLVDAGPARAPALIVQGSPDPVGSEAGSAELRISYGSTGGGDATLVTLPGASHLMRFDSGISDGPTSPFWSTVLAFLAAN